MIKNGDVVRLKPDYCTEKERNYIYAVVNTNEKTGRCDISCLNSGLALPPTETVMLEMVDPVGTTVEDIINSQPAPSRKDKNKDEMSR